MGSTVCLLYGVLAEGPGEEQARHRDARRAGTRSGLYDTSVARRREWKMKSERTRGLLLLCAERKQHLKMENEKRKTERQRSHGADGRSYGISFLFRCFCRLIKRHTKLPTHNLPPCPITPLFTNRPNLPPRPSGSIRWRSVSILLRHHVCPLQVPVCFFWCVNKRVATLRSVPRPMNPYY